MAEWRSTVFGSEPALLALAECLQRSSWRLTYEGNGCCLVRNERAVAENLAVFADEAGRIVDRANIVCKVANPHHEALSLGPPVLLKDDGTKQYLVRVLIPIKIEFGHSVKLKHLGGELVDVIWTPAPEPSFDYNQAYAKLAAAPTVEQIIKSFLESPHDWGQIYKVVELIKHYYRGKIPTTVVSEKKLCQITATACSWLEAGRTGRHANPTFRGPPKPMGIDEGEQLTRRLLIFWLQDPNVS